MTSETTGEVIMVQERHEQVRIQRGDGYQKQEKVVAYAPSTRTVLVARLNRLIWLFVGVVNVLIALRFVLKLIAANPGNSFASFIYSLTDGLVAPFISLINAPVVANGAIVEVAAIFAIIVYTLVALAVTQLFRILFASAGGSRQVTRVERQSID
jgi:uncharacterized protein YggT (Ycf19 family)